MPTLKILDHRGNPIARAALSEPQTSRIATLANQFVESNADGLTPARVARILKSADAGNLRDQHILFDDIHDRDIHIRSEFGKRASVITALDWDIVPPADATAAEKATAEWVRETLLNAVDDFEDMLAYLMDAVGHGFAPVEYEWQMADGMRIPKFHHRPQTWFQLDQVRRELRLADSTPDGAAPVPFGWCIHKPAKVKTGYHSRAGLYRSLVWPFLYRAYAVGDFAEFLEVYGLPIIVGKYFSGASPDEKASLLRAVTQLGHDARAIMPAEMALEIQQVTGGAGGSHHMAMAEWAEKSISRGIVGATLTSGADGKSSTNALGNVHNEVRHDIRDSDARSLGATLTRDLVYPLIVINRGAIALSRCPRFVFDTGEAEDIKTYAEALPGLAGLFDIPASFARKKLRIPEPQAGEELLRAPSAPAPDKNLPPSAGGKAPAALAALSALPLSADTDPATLLSAGMDAETAPAWNAVIAHLESLVAGATSLEELQTALVEAYGGLPAGDLRGIMAAGFAVAELAGIADVRAGS